MSTQVYTNSVTLTDATEFDRFDTAAYCYLTGASGTNTVTATGPANMTLATPQHPVILVPAVTNSGATTLNITPSGGAALGAKAVFCNGISCVGGELKVGVPAILVYDGTQYQIVGPMVGGTIPGAVTLQSTLAVTGTVSPLGLVDISGASAGQIKFPATQNASADANTLDDYEEGTWTPNQGTGLTLVGAFSSNGQYTKIGRQVHLQGQVVGATSVAVAATGQISSNIPFTANAGASAGMGGATNNSVNVSNVTYVAASSIQILSCTAIAASASIFFTASYMV